MSSVLERTLERCRTALLGGAPMLYVKTDSDVFIRKLITYETNPLVVLLSNGGQKATESQRDQMKWRPIYELDQSADKRLEFCANYKNELPSRSPGTGIYNDLNKATGDKRLRGPFLWVYKMPDSGENLSDALRKLERYVVDHEDPSHPQYAALQSSVILLYSSTVNLSPMLKTYTQFIDIDYPDEEEIRQLLKTESGGDPNLVENEAYLSALCTAFLGFTAEEVTMTMHHIMAVSSLERSSDVENLISERKRQKMQGGILELDDAESSIGGMERFRQWLDEQVDPLKNSNAYMRKVGTPPPKGVLLCGIPGCGKSEAARFTAQALDLPLLKMDVGSLMDKYQGVSEQKMRDALRMAEAMSPCVLWIDELEKGFSGARSSDDSASFKRMFGYLLGWMQDNKKPCFIFATANDIGGLPKEFFRSGRFDALYAVYLPTAEECADIFLARMEQAEKNIACTLHQKEAHIFENACYSPQLFRNIINGALVRSDGRPRIIIGSDIQQAVTIALRTLAKRNGGSPSNLISARAWEQALKDAISSPTFSTYGDGEENVDSIAVSYCRMLRKGFTPTSGEGKELFRKEDYHMENALEYERLKNLSTSSMDEKQRLRHEQALLAHRILQDPEPSFSNSYDTAVYTYLLARINEMALPLEQRERELILRR